MKKIKKRDESSSPVAGDFGNQDAEQMQNFDPAPGSDVIDFDEEVEPELQKIWAKDTRNF